MKLLVTGGNGFIGSRVVRALSGRDRPPRCLLRAASDVRRIAHLPYERATGDILDRQALQSAAAGCDATIHLASPSAWRQIRSANLQATVCAGTLNVVEAAAQAGHARLVLVSSAAAINGTRAPQVSNEESPFQLAGTGLQYAIAKHQAERIALGIGAARGLDIVIVNPVETYGPDDTGFITAGNLRDILTSWPAFGCHGGSAIAHVDDVAEGIILALERGRSGQRYILGGDNLSIERLVRLTLAVAGRRRTPVVMLPNRVVEIAVRALSRLGVPTPTSPDVLDYATRYWFVDDSKARRELGYSRRSARMVLSSTIDWLYASGAVRRSRSR